MLSGSPRTLKIFGQQLLNFFQYCSWQWGRSLPNIPMVIVSLGFVSLGMFPAPLGGKVAPPPGRGLQMPSEKYTGLLALILTYTS